MRYLHITKENIDREHICCAMSGRQSLAKKEWMKQRFDEGLVFYRSEERGKCFIEYIPAENAWVPIKAEGWLYIDCLWIAGALKGHGYANELLGECMRDAAARGKAGVCILSAEGRKREFLADPKFLAYKGFRVADRSDCGITLMYLPLEPGAEPREIQRLRQAPRGDRGGVCSLLYRPVPVYVLLGAAGAGGGGGARRAAPGRPYHRQRNRAKRPRAGHDLCLVPGRQIYHAEHSVRQKIPGTGGSC